ncbi:MAG: FAD-binding oxidoreductase [Dehalococcoidales bacterium]|jgi:FAD/FMN-containing dehydrogenase
MALKGLEQIVSADSINDRPTALAEFSGDFSFTPSVKPIGVVRPADAAEVQAIVKWANETHTPLIPVSSGAPRFRGDTVPGTDGAVVIDLSRMKKIIRIDTRNKLAMVQPGVTYTELQPELAKVGLTAYMPLSPRQNKSVIGSVLEREPIIMPAHHWDSTDPLLCAEVVFGTGDIFRTGEASGPDTVEEQWEVGRVQMNPFGHSHVDFQRLISGAQGTIGIVTWATVKCCYLSRESRAFFVAADKLEPLADLIYQPLKFRLGGKLFILNNLNLACLLGKNAPEIQKLAKDLPPWALFISFEGYGVLPADKIAYEEADFTAMAKSAHLNPLTELPGVKAKGLNALLSQPSPEPYWKTRLKGNAAEVFFLTTLDKTPSFTAAIAGLAREHNYPTENIGVYVQPIVQGTSCHCEFDFYYDPANSGETETVKKLIGLAAEKIGDLGGFFSRPYNTLKDTAYRHAAGTLAMQKKVKAIFDPNNVLNPGKLGF